LLYWFFWTSNLQMIHRDTFFWDKILLYIPGWCWNFDPPASCSRELWLQECTTMSGLLLF
jgi:hypothetical protein